jgi:hypothetical protein
MTLSSGLRSRVEVALTAGMLGCTTVAGIKEGHPGEPADSGAPADSASDSTLPNQPDGEADGTTPGDGGPDAPYDGPADSPPDAPSPELACSVIESSRILVDDSANEDAAGGAGFINGVWIAKSTTENQIFVFTQLAADPTQFLEYDVDFNAGSSFVGRGWTGIGDGRGVQLIDVSTAVSGTTVVNAALATFPAGGSGKGPSTGLQVIPLPPSFTGFIPGNPVIVADAFLADIQSGVFVQTTTTSADWLVATQGTNIQRYNVFAGSGSDADASGPQQILATSTTTPYDVTNAPLLDMGGSLYAMVSGIDPSGSVSVFAEPDDFSADASASTIGGSTHGRVLTARPSTVDPTSALVLMVVPEASQLQARVFGAITPPGRLSSLAAGAAPWTGGSLLGLAEVPSASAGIGWLDDETALIGPTQDGSGLQLLWIGPDGRLVSHSATSGVLLPGGSNQVAGSAVQFDKHFGETQGTLFAVWIENIPARGSQRIYAIKVSCAPPGADGG